MKLAVIGLCFLGLLAAACASVLVNGLRVNTAATSAGITGGKTDENPEIRVLFVTRNVPSMTVIDGSMVGTNTMHRGDAPTGYLTDPAEVVGKVIAVPVVAGQPFMKTAFLDLSQPRQLATIIPQGKRAVSISVTDYGGLEGLVFPGSMVDVLVSFKPTDSGNSHRDAVAATLLHGVQVLALDQQTVLAPGKMIDQIVGRQGNSRRVTLLVDTEQAKAIELAMDQGTLSLALRNPLDTTQSDREIVSIQSLLGNASMIPHQSSATPSTNWASMMQTALAAMASNKQAAAPSDAQQTPSQPAEKPHRDITVIRGNAVETVTVPLSSDTAAKLEQASR
jgi:pilus assembly protein CpaB